MSRWTHDSRRYRKALAQVQAIGPTCWICGHPGSDSIDHAIPASVAPDLAGNPANWRPVHGINGCPHCPPNSSGDKRRNGQPTRCNQSRGARLQPVRPPVTSRRW